MNKLYILVGFTLNFSLLFAQECNKNVYSEDEAMKLSAYGKNLEKSILEKNPADTALIAKLKGDFSSDLCGYTDDESVKLSNYLKALEKQDSINKKVAEPVIETKIETVTKETETVVEKPLTPISNTTGNTKTVETLLFESNSSQLKVAEISAIIAQLKANKKLTVNIDGYTDADASSEFNMALSKRRAKTVKDYLISKGISASRITINAHGEDNPVADNNSEEGKAKNRRAIISIK
jgi:outer membrane protein OmpA-like peptidoglycan-associated protein